MLLVILYDSLPFLIFRSNRRNTPFLITQNIFPVLSLASFKKTFTGIQAVTAQTVKHILQVFRILLKLVIKKSYLTIISAYSIL